MIIDIKSLFRIENKKYFINVSSYLLFVISNLIFLILIPGELSKVFFINYSIANGIFSYFVVLLFSKKENLDVRYFLFFSFLALIYCYVYENLVLLIWLYTLILIYADYFFSQKKYTKSNLFIKFSLLLFSCLLFFDQFTISLVMNIKILFLIIFIIIFYILKINLNIPLEVKKPNLYVISTCFIYFGSLYIIAFISINEFIKLFYISFQIFLSIRLKFFDLNIRGILKVNNFNKILFILAFMYFIILSIYSSSYLLFILYLISYFSLNYVDKKFIGSQQF
tara:strand:- start:2811 stop:3653 length:843 start_codon:yes stop_codon:yes gene_type:complete